MERNTHNIYLFKALESYPYELSKAMEALNYALSYEPNNQIALCLMGRLQTEQLQNYEVAKGYFEQAIAIDCERASIYPDYIDTLLRNEDYEAAQRAIDYALTLKGADRGGIKLLQGQLFEAIQEYERGEVALKEALQFGLNSGFISHVESELERVSKKRERKNRQQVKNKEEQSTSEKQKVHWLRNLNSLL